MYCTDRRGSGFSAADANSYSGGRPKATSRRRCCRAFGCVDAADRDSSVEVAVASPFGLPCAGAPLRSARAGYSPCRKFMTRTSVVEARLAGFVELDGQQEAGASGPSPPQSSQPRPLYHPRAWHRLLIFVYPVNRIPIGPGVSALQAGRERPPTADVETRQPAPPRRANGTLSHRSTGTRRDSTSLPR